MPSYDLDPSEIAVLWKSIFKPEAQIDLEGSVSPDWTNTNYCLETALQLARLSHVIYVRDVAERATLLKRMALKELAGDGEAALHWSRFEPEENPQGVSIICFRGTTDLRHWIYNVSALLVEWPSGGQVHRGFAKAYERLETTLCDELASQTDKTLIFTGHSLGAALALLAASKVDAAQAYTFGAPRPGTRPFAEALKSHCRVHRVVHGHDFVTQLPQHWRFLDERAFVHPGEVVHIHDDGSQIVGDETAIPKPDDMLRDSLLAMVEWDRLAEPVPALLHHAPINYVRALKACLERRKLS